MAGLLQKTGKMISLNLHLELYKKIYLIRKAEEAIVKNYPSDEMKTPMHMSMGEEAIVVGVCEALKPNFQTFGTYRSHALYLTVSGDTDGFFCEMYGKKNGIEKGKGGSMHLSNPQHGLMATSAVVASTIPIAVGSAYANKYLKKDKIVAVFFGDGAVDEGVFWESLNIACLMKLPVIFVCEDNGYAVHTESFKRHGYRSIESIVENFNCKVFSSQSTDASEIYEITKKAVIFAKKEKKAVFLYFKYYRYLEHVGVNWDFDKGYRSETEFKKWFKKDPVKLQKKRLLSLGFDKTQIEKVENAIAGKIEKSIQKAKKSTFPENKEVFEDVFYESK